MPTFYNFTENGSIRSFDDVFVPAEFFRDGNLWSWGQGSNGQLGNRQLLLTSTPVTTSTGSANWKQVYAGITFSSAIKTDGTLWCWGTTNGAGSLGNGAITGNISTPVTTFLGGNNWRQICIGQSLSVLAIKTDGTLWCWGYNNSGELGNATQLSRSTPVTTFLGGNNWKQVSCNGSSTTYRTAAIKTDGTLWTWGNAVAGALGSGVTTGYRSTPVTTFLGGTNWKQVSFGANHISAIKTDGTLWTWGTGTSGELGNNLSLNRSTPITTFLGGNNWKQVSCGNAFTAAIKNDGTLWAWGAGSNGRLGNAQISNRITPVTTFLGGSNWKSVDASGTSVFAIKTDGTLWTWGVNQSYQLGNGNATTISRSTPITTFLGGNNWKQASGGSSHAAAVTYIDYPSPT